MIVLIDAVAAYFAANGGFVATDVFGDLADALLAYELGNIVSLF